MTDFVIKDGATPNTIAALRMSRAAQSQQSRRYALFGMSSRSGAPLLSQLGGDQGVRARIQVFGFLGGVATPGEAPCVATGARFVVGTTKGFVIYKEIKGQFKPVVWKAAAASDGAAAEGAYENQPPFPENECNLYQRPGNIF